MGRVAQNNPLSCEWENAVCALNSTNSIYSIFQSKGAGKTMHNALLISEVFKRIVDHLAEDTVRHPTAFPFKDTRRAGRQALAVLARTCHVLSEPALDALWRRLHSLRPLLLCLPSKTKYDNAIADGSLSMPPLDEQEWSFVFRYTSRVQELTLEHDYLSIRILQSLWFRTTLLLPNLRRLSWTYEDYAAITSIRLLLSPSLVHLDVWLDDGDHSSVLGFLEYYHILCPSLKSLRFAHFGRFPHVTAAVSRALSRSPNLETLKCDYGVDEAALVHIAESNCLKKLSANLFAYEPDTLKTIASYGTPDHPPFKNLRTLDLCAKDPSSIIPYLRSQHQPFEKISFDFRTLPTPEVFSELVNALSSATRRSTLRHIKLVFTGGHGIPSQHVDFHVLKPLMAFPLHTFDVNIDMPISLNDNELESLVQAWPNLETFNLNQVAGWDHRQPFQVPTLRGLLLLLARCSKLHDLGLCIDARTIPSLSVDELLIRNTAVKRLSLANSLIQAPIEGVAHFLHEHLPSLTALPPWAFFGGYTSSMQDTKRMWKEVELQIQKTLGQDSSLGLSDSEI